MKSSSVYQIKFTTSLSTSQPPVLKGSLLFQYDSSAHQKTVLYFKLTKILFFECAI